ncbi:MAG: hypothetical protein LBI53_07520 [Candidatus Peribacteria bacterium]|nr:hypothetical protein [Candidatus Peribacteria bacterium]
MIFNLLYHIIVTVGIYGIEFVSTSFPAMLREGIWCLFILFIVLFNYDQRKAYRNKRKRNWITCIITLTFAIALSYFFLDKTLGDIVIGIKYGFQRILILLTATIIGFFYQQKINTTEGIQRLKRTLIITVIAGFIRQGMKLLFPEWFGQLGYELKLDDFHF